MQTTFVRNVLWTFIDEEGGKKSRVRSSILRSRDRTCTPRMLVRRSQWERSLIIGQARLMMSVHVHHSRVRGNRESASGFEANFSRYRLPLRIAE